MTKKIRPSTQSNTRMIGKWPALWPDSNVTSAENDSDAVVGQSTIPIIRVFGESGAGKTMFGIFIISRPAGSEPPTVIFDYELGSKTYASQYALAYHDMISSDESKNKQFENFLQAVDEIEPNQYAVAIIDPAEVWEEGLQEYVKANPSKFGMTSGQLLQGGRPSGLFWGVTKKFMRDILTNLASKVQTVVLVNHIRQAYNGNQPIPGKKEPKGSEALQQLATISAWLLPNAKGQGTPSARIMKSRLVAPNWDDVDEYGATEMKSVLPLYVTEFSAKSLRRYLQEAGKANFTETEMQNFDPATLYKMSDEERLTIELQIEQERADQARQLAKQQDLQDRQHMIQALLESKIFTSEAEISLAANQFKESAGKVLADFGGDRMAYAGALAQWYSEQKGSNG